MKALMLAVATGVGLGAGTAYTMHAVSRYPQIAMLDSEAEAAQHAPRRLIVGLDLSKSNPLIDDADFAAKVGDRVAGEVARLGFGSEVHLRTFGSYDAGTNDFYYDVVISIRNRPQTVAREVRRAIASAPMLVREGKWHAQNWTNILGFLDNMAHSIGCSGLPTTVILASDGIEDSEMVRLTRAARHLPEPEGRPFAGCAEMQILGIGQGTESPRVTEHLREEWTRWARQAGFKKFEGLNDW